MIPELNRPPMAPTNTTAMGTATLESRETGSAAESLILRIYGAWPPFACWLASALTVMSL